MESNLSHVRLVVQSYGILPVPPIPSIQCVRPIPPAPCKTSGTVLWNPTCPTNTLNPICPSYLSHVRQVGQTYGILPVPPTPAIHVGLVGQSYVSVLRDSPIESYLSHQQSQSYVSILSHLFHVGQVGQSYVSVLPVPCKTSGTVLWNPTCPTNTLNHMYLSYPTCPM